MKLGMALTAILTVSASTPAAAEIYQIHGVQFRNGGIADLLFVGRGQICSIGMFYLNNNIRHVDTVINVKRNTFADGQTVTEPVIIASVRSKKGRESNPIRSRFNNDIPDGNLDSATDHFYVESLLSDGNGLLGVQIDIQPTCPSITP